MSAKLTPWRTAPTDDTLVIDADRADVAQVLGNYEDDYEVMEAHARLIAAAPDLYAALQQCSDVLDLLRTAGESRYCYLESRSGNMVRIAEQIDAARTALAKARGES